MAQNSEKIVVKPNVWHFKGGPVPPVSFASHERLTNPYIYPYPSIKEDDGWEVVENEDWELVWASGSQAFHPYNRFTNAKEEITTPDYRKRYDSTVRSTAHQPTSDSKTDDTHNAALNQPPSQAAKHDALEAILKANYKHLVPQLLQNYGMDLNIRLFKPMVTPLYHATELEDVQLAKMFLSKGADPNIECMGRNPLIRAVEKRNEELTKILILNTDRVRSTKALCQAVRLQATAIVNILLANGVKCDFEESDRPRPLIDEDVSGVDNGYVCGYTDMKEDWRSIRWFIPPLIYAVKQDNGDLARLLLVNGADANIGYHGLDSETQLTRVCGRPIQLAMELKYYDMVQLLLDFGADVCFAKPTRQSCPCAIISREEHLEVTAALMEAAASRK